MGKKLNKCASFTDIHWGAKANSELHNQDCLRYVDWFIDQVKSDPEIDHIMFLGDWFENRSSLNIQTLKYAQEGFNRLRGLNLPFFFVVGNHDLYHRHTRDTYSPVVYKDFQNVVVVDKPIIVPHIGTGAMISPYLFHEEYPHLVEYLGLETWWGHFEFKGFVITGYNQIMQQGPNPEDFKGPKHIMSGHFHKRQAFMNVVYQGNTFPTNFGDAGDTSRGLMTFDHNSGDMLFYDWPDCPRYIKTSLSDLLDKSVTLYPEARVKCIVDIPVTFEESTYLRQKYTEDYKLREFQLEESLSIKEALSNTEVKVNWDEHELSSVNDLVIQMLKDIESDHIDNKMLAEIYQDLK